MNEDKELKTMTLDLAKALSFLTELEKTNNQKYVTGEGVSLLEGVVIAGNGKVKVCDYGSVKEHLDELRINYEERIKCSNGFRELMQPKYIQEIEELKAKLNSRHKQKKSWF